MAKLSGSEIEKQVQEGNIVIKPWNKRHLGPNSYDLMLGRHLMCPSIPSDGYMDVAESPRMTSHIIPSGGFVLKKNQLYLAHTVEIAGSMKYVPCIEGRSSVARHGIQVHLTAGFGDVGFVGQWTLEILVAHPIKVYENMRICQIYFDTIEGEVKKKYNGKYNGSKGVIPSRLYKDFGGKDKNTGWG